MEYQNPDSKTYRNGKHRKVAKPMKVKNDESKYTFLRMGGIMQVFYERSPGRMMFVTNSPKDIEKCKREMIERFENRIKCVTNLSDEYWSSRSYSV